MDAYDGKTEYHQNIGMGLAIAGNLVISIALNITKYAHNLNQQSETPVPFMCMPLWWMGFLLTAFGEVGNFAAYGFGEASLIAPLGAVAVLANAFIASVFLGERFRCVDAIGCVLCVAGGVIIVRSVPSHPSELDPDGFLQSLEATPFVVYIATVTALVSLMLYFQDRYGELHVAYYVLLCSLLGSITVMSCKGVRAASHRIEPCTRALHRAVHAAAHRPPAATAPRRSPHSSTCGCAAARRLHSASPSCTRSASCWAAPRSHRSTT